ncbi:hypothetical protein AcW1_006973 [Taiwanofungus camphoratus]|nr:hypothetical protein AcV5_002775 [Antrodia cinnamomea]KAI0925023.1 hypothetical protein AcW2_005725 [Antrodia cinnamomea]KAI0955370.1 hypothetical protein AcW1_006973 [Antrodia cinnamomea]
MYLHLKERGLRSNDTLDRPGHSGHDCVPLSRHYVLLLYMDVAVCFLSKQSHVGLAHIIPYSMTLINIQYRWMRQPDSGMKGHSSRADRAHV